VVRDYDLIQRCSTSETNIEVGWIQMQRAAKYERIKTYELLQKEADNCWIREPSPLDFYTNRNGVTLFLPVSLFCFLPSFLFYRLPTFSQTSSHISSFFVFSNFVQFSTAISSSSLLTQSGTFRVSQKSFLFSAM